MLQFIEFSKPTSENKVLLILDGHSSHTKNIKAIDLARKNNVIILVVPPHCTHKLQPVDLSFNKPFSSAFGKEHSTWIKKNKKINKLLNFRSFFEVFTPAWQKVCASPENATSGFRAAGIFPFNINTFSKKDFFAATRFEKSTGM